MAEEFTKVYRTYYQPIVRYFARAGVPEEQQKDLASETFLRAFRGYAQFRGEAQVTTWLFKIARHVLYNDRRDQNAGKRAGQEFSFEALQEDGEQFPYGGVYNEVEGANPLPLQEILDEERGHLLRESLKALPDQMRYCVTLRLQGMKYREIASVQKISVETVKAHLFQARKRLKELLGEHFEQIEFGGAP
jgi:RNA polymerase sigma-70 factor (ECF subfamily)